MQPAISVVILSHDRIFADALEAVLASEADLRIVAASQEQETSSASRPDDVDVVLIDAARDHDAALASTWQARESFAGAQVIVFGLDREDEGAIDFIQAGASGYVLQSASPALLTQVIRAVRSGQTFCAPHIAAGVLERISRLAQEEPSPAERISEPLTERELKVLALIAKGLRNKEIGRALHITVQTVKNHVHSILAKLGVHRRREAVRLAYELGLLHQPQTPLDLF